MINKNKIFDLFESQEGDNSTSQTLDLPKPPIYNIGMFSKIILNHKTFHQKLQSFFQKEAENYNAEVTKKYSEFTVYNRAWFYIKDVNIKKKIDLESLISFDNQLLLSSLKSAIKYFEGREEYEKCAHLFTIQKVLEDFQK